MVNSQIRIAARAVIVRDEAILLVEYHGRDNNDIHYNFPGGGVDYGETLQQTVEREVLEETCVTAQVHDLLFIYEHMTVSQNGKHSLNFFFRASIAEDAVPCMPANPDVYPHVYQSAVVWMPLSELRDAPLYLNASQPILNALTNPTSIHILDTIHLP